MLKTLGRILILVTIIGIVAATLITIVNSSSSNAGFPTGGGQGVFQTRQTNRTRPEFQGQNRKGYGGGAFISFELLKNLGIIASITAVIILLQKGMDKMKPVRREMNG
jgi:hypothetical protein